MFVVSGPRRCCGGRRRTSHALERRDANFNVHPSIWSGRIRRRFFFRPIVMVWKSRDDTYKNLHFDVIFLLSYIYCCFAYRVDFFILCRLKVRHNNEKIFFRWC